MQSKICSKCKLPFPLTDEFWPKQYGKYRELCKACHKAYTALWREKNREKHRQYSTEYYENHKEEILEGYKRRYRKNPEPKRASNKIYRRENPEKVREMLSKWEKANPTKRRVYSQNRKARKKNNGGSYTSAELQQLYEDQGHRCFHCAKFISLNNGKTCHIDHWIPLARGGSNNIDNIRLLCPYCNLSKNDQLPSEWQPSIYPPT